MDLYEYRGKVIAVFPSGHISVHHMNPDGSPLGPVGNHIGEGNAMRNMEAAKKEIDIHIAGMRKQHNTKS